MSRIDDLIQELCPLGVEYRTVGQVMSTVSTGRGIKRDKYDAGERFPIVDQGQALIAGYTDDESLLVPAGEFVVFGEHTREVKWVNFRFAPGADGTKVLQARDGLLTKFAYHALANLAIPNRGYNRHWTVLRDLRIPIPPLEVQEEIVRVLDAFQALEAELEAELEARRRQYAYYRNALLSFPTDDETRWSTLGEICVKISSGATPLVSRPDYYQGGNIPWLRTQEVAWRDIDHTEMKITDTAVRETAAKWIPENCVIVAISGATAGRAAVNTIPLTTNQHCCNLEVDPKQANYRYVFHWVTANYEKLKSLGRGARSDLTSALIKSFPIAVPSVQEQERIAVLLDYFDALVNDLSIGLPAELNARRKQYEYYRDRLLTFQEVEL